MYIYIYIDIRISYVWDDCISQRFKLVFFGWYPNWPFCKMFLASPRMWRNASVMAPRPAPARRPPRASRRALRPTCDAGGSPCGPRAHPLWRAMDARKAA